MGKSTKRGAFQGFGVFPTDLIVSGRVKTYTSLAITYKCAYSITRRGPRTSSGFWIRIRRSVGRSCGTSPVKRRMRLRPSGLASPPKDGEPNFSRASRVWRLGGGPRGWRDDLPKEHRELLIALYSLTVLMDLGLDPASKQARKMIDRVERGSCLSGSTAVLSFAAKRSPASTEESSALARISRKPNEALAKQLLSEQLEDGGWNCEAPKSRALFVS